MHFGHETVKFPRVCGYDHFGQRIEQRLKGRERSEFTGHTNRPKATVLLGLGNDSSATDGRGVEVGELFLQQAMN